VGHVPEGVPARAGARRPPEVVDRDGVDAAFREPERQLIVERVETADIRQYRDTRTPWLGRPGAEGGQDVAVGSGDRRPLALERAAGDRHDRWMAVEVMAHARILRRPPSATLGARETRR